MVSLDGRLLWQQQFAKLNQQLGTGTWSRRTDLASVAGSAAGPTPPFACSTSWSAGSAASVPSEASSLAAVAWDCRA